MYLKIGKHYLVFFLLLFCAGGCVEIRLRVPHAGFNSARAVSFDEIVVLFFSEIKPRDLHLSFHGPLRSHKIFMTALSGHVLAGKNP